MATSQNQKNDAALQSPLATQKFEVTFILFYDKDGTGEFKADEVLKADHIDPASRQLLRNTPVYDLSTDQPGEPLSKPISVIEAKPHSLPALNGLASVKLPKAITYQGTPLYLPCNEFVFNAMAFSHCRFQVGYQQQQAALLVSTCAYSAAPEDCDQPMAKRHRPLPGVGVRIFNGASIASTAVYELTTSQFTVPISDVKPGYYAYELTPPRGYQSYQPPSRSAVICIEGGEKLELHFCFKASPSIVEGEVIYGEGQDRLSGEVMLEGATLEGYQLELSANLDENGCYRFDDVPLGNYQLRVLKILIEGGAVDSSIFANHTRLVQVSQPGRVQVPALHVPAVTADNIRVALTDDSGQPMAGERIELLDRSGKTVLAEGISDTDGQVLFNRLTRGLRYLRFKNGDGQLYPVEE